MSSAAWMALAFAKGVQARSMSHRQGKDSEDRYRREKSYFNRAEFHDPPRDFHPVFGAVWQKERQDSGIVSYALNPA